MYYLTAGEFNNSKQISKLTSNTETANKIMDRLYDGRLNVDRVINKIFTQTSFTEKEYDGIIMVLTVGDLLPPNQQIDNYLAMAYFFALQVNNISNNNKLNKNIPSPYLAKSTAVAFNWSVEEYIDHEESLSDQLSMGTNITFKCRFTYIFNKFTISIPVVQVKKGFLRKKTVGYMIDPSPKAFGVFSYGNVDENYKLPKSYLLNLLDVNNIKSFIFNDYTDILMTIDRTNSASIVLELLYVNNFFGICSFSIDEGQAWIEDDDLLYIESNRAPKYDNDDEDHSVPASWENLQNHKYRAIINNRKPYISYKYNNKIALLAN